ncbi:D-alanyl-D-alanine carboxypeptidase/D-alanyl-D-alanine-endopeptidase (penicillin-binding protein 4) [Anseongella ginsenosidimutans]|uniref:D-alanyl-D-alanine carboxypeptidase/D-alanyl-D-alanine-endopeptidase (Penicillin-binding protein 4) n=1 Tax=Anseongella ginsenosidimutans TaxID=496056 RepID=A0A4R3KN36_9SPHI|nr:D-alanyl-D-alanine carboxypeptidase/D-alanyl-D-alanine-endopeptidase [Anseongella ginsenosidimutans]QEC52489.1 D-alanyl-D-alanine carboxypeptidase/D-alanyl-D-alanine-endopeptidase [Anseongella ginsenosidimutans]TCS85332.1 D-alanyl-D-alanine carboxypeptidase/D-alanyl-D-alanine-endopeptidase (penicillin-binding protein 4) [Anseongella ginsenosidimutans]
MAYFYSILTGTLLIFSGNFLLAQPSHLAAAFSRFEQDEQMRYGIAAICVLDARTGETVFARNAHTGMATASTLKTITSITSFSLLGPDYRYRTQLSYTGKLGPGGVLQGDLLIRGSGDPTLGSWRWPQTAGAVVLETWVAAVKKAGIQRIEGRIIGDDSRMGTQTIPGGWQWDDIGNYYGAGSSALNWRENQFDILLAPSQVGGPVKMSGTRPQMDYLEFVNELQTGPAGSGDRAYAYLPPYRNIAYLRGTYAIDERERAISAAIPDPAFECAYRFLEALEKSGIPVSGEAGTSRRLQLEGASTPVVAAGIADFTSPSLAEIIKEFNHKSINLYGESLVKTLAIESGKRGSTGAGVQVIREFWAGKGIDSASLAMVDGSGLSPANRITVSSMARILQQARNESWFSDFYQSLPLQNGMRMKSGSIQGVRGYTGYHTASDGRKYVFAFIVNNYNGSSSAIRRKIWAILDLLK